MINNLQVHYLKKQKKKKKAKKKADPLPTYFCIPKEIFLGRVQEIKGIINLSV